MFSGDTSDPSDLSPAAVAAARERRKESKASAKLAKSAKRSAAAAEAAAAAALAARPLPFAASPPARPWGDYGLIRSSTRSSRVYSPVAALPSLEGQAALVRARVHSVRSKGGGSFLVLREAGTLDTVQAAHFKKSDAEHGGDVARYIAGLPAESIVDVEGVVVPAQVRSCTLSTHELAVSSIHAVSRASPPPFTVEDAARSSEVVEASQATERPFPRLGQELRLDSRWLDLRTPSSSSILRVRSAVCQLFREALYAEGFAEIQTPKLLPGESESGAGVFRTDYFGSPACLAQSPQLHKQMCISGDAGRVFEVGPVFRAENSNTRRHLCEFTGLDFEMEIKESYEEALEVAHGTFKHIFEGLETRWARDLSAIRSQYPSSPVLVTDDPCVLHWREGQEILAEEGFDMGDGMQDLTGKQELALGRVVREKYGTDFFILHKYPASIRPFYTMKCPDDPNYSNSYDMFIRGLEISSGAQRCHDVGMLVENIEAKGIEDWEGSLGKYVDSFRHGISPHAGAGIGLERVVFLFLGLDNVRKATIFPRDPNRIKP
ncbi:hypothetical protein TeGR_g3628 [Tetraparma gracilis]|uniref:aspartate--tRNA ligase n=1 Tax=Tetraparma gracilis TaxID=2962635 RepID=A0ABQ6MQH8_9STRA|nr:hypothetical protein TeGR_g3628 [Tetraparma gracilis]